MGVAQPTTNKEWEISNAVDTLIRAEEIRADKKLFAAAKKEMTRRARALDTAMTKVGARRRGLKKLAEK